MAGRHDHAVPSAVAPVPDSTAARALGDALRRVGYAEAGIVEALGDEAYSGGRLDRAVHVRGLGDGAFATVVRALFLELAVPAADLEAALGREAVAALAATGLADVRTDVVPRARVAPIGDLLLASDGYSRGGDDPSGYVATYTPAARRCDALTPRPRVARALDVGTGSGYHALVAARHSRRVVATDVNPRALAFTELNAALNRLDNVECRLGSLFDPVAGESFGLVVCNPPYVVSPETRWAYRDSEHVGDEVSERVVRGAAPLLAEGGLATLLVSWLAVGEDAYERPRSWVAGNGCDAWILDFGGEEPLAHAATWNWEAGAEEDAYGATLDEWTSYLDGLGVRAVHEGAALLHRRAGARNTIRVDAVDADEVDAADAQIRRAFAARARLAELRRRAELLDARVSPASAVRVEHEVRARRGRAEIARAWVRLDEGTYPVVAAPAAAAEVVASLDGDATLARVIDRVARTRGLSRAEAETLGRSALRVVRELLELGALRIR